jgi:hypothetical protein
MKYLKLYEEQKIEPGKWYYVEPDLDDDFSKYTEVPGNAIALAKSLLRSTRYQQLEGFKKYFGGAVFESIEIKEGEEELDILADDEMRDVKVLKVTTPNNRKKLILRYKNEKGEISEKEITKNDLERGEMSIDVFNQNAEGRPQLKSDIFRFRDPHKKAKRKLMNTRLRQTRGHDNAIEIAKSFKKCSKREVVKGLQLYFEKIFNQEQRT